MGLMTVLLTILVLAAALGAVGCDELPPDGYGYGPIGDDVFQNSVDAWDEYIRM